MSKSVVFLCVFARSNGGNVEKCRVFVCFLGKVEKCRVFVCVLGFCVFLLGRRGEMSKSVVFLNVFARSKGGNGEKCCVFVCFLGKVEKCRVFVCFGFLCVFVRWKGRKCRKVSCLSKVSCFCCVLGEVGDWGPLTRVHNLLYNRERKIDR